MKSLDDMLGIIVEETETSDNVTKKRKSGDFRYANSI